MSRFLLPESPSCGLDVQADAGGVHYNSGILNRAFYLLAAGLPGAIGRLDAERVFYRALALHLTSNAQFVDVRLAAVASAQELFGAGSSQALRTAEAFDTVEIYDGAGTGQGAPLPPVAAPDSTLFVRFESSVSTQFLMRRETALGDPAGGTPLSFYDVGWKVSSVTRDGSVAWFVDSIDDACAIETDADTVTFPAQQESCAGLIGLIASLAVSPDGNTLAVVLQDPDARRTRWS